jgi:hypothetical protein
VRDLAEWKDVEVVIAPIVGGDPPQTRDALRIENHFFAGKAAVASVTDRGRCPPAEQRSCCDADADEDCCDAALEEGFRCR